MDYFYQTYPFDGTVYCLTGHVAAWSVFFYKICVNIQEIICSISIFSWKWITPRVLVEVEKSLNFFAGDRG